MLLHGERAYRQVCNGTHMHDQKHLEKLWLVNIWHLGSVFCFFVFFYKRFILLVLKFLDFTFDTWKLLWKVSYRLNKRAVFI